MVIMRVSPRLESAAVAQRSASFEKPGRAPALYQPRERAGGHELKSRPRLLSRDGSACCIISKIVRFYARATVARVPPASVGLSLLLSHPVKESQVADVDGRENQGPVDCPLVGRVCFSG